MLIRTPIPTAADQRALDDEQVEPSQPEGAVNDELGVSVAFLVNLGEQVVGKRDDGEEQQREADRDEVVAYVHDGSSLVERPRSHMMV